MVRPTLDEIFGQRPSLDEIFSEKSAKLKPLPEEQKAKPKGVDYWEVAKAGLEGFGEGIEGGINRAINAASFGGYDWLNRKFLGDQYGKQQRELQQRAESANVGGLNTIANLLTDIGSGGATTGNVAYNLAGKAGLKGLGQLIGAGALEGGVWGATSSDTLEQAATNIPVSAITGGIVSGGLGAVGNALKRFSPKLSSIGLKSGLENALTDDETVKALKRGALDEGIANQLLARESEVKNALNTRSADTIEALTGQRFDIEGAKQANRQAYKDYFADNAEKQILNPRNVEADVNSPEFKAWFGESKIVDESGKPLKVYHGTTADFENFDTSKSPIGSWFSNSKKTAESVVNNNLDDLSFDDSIEKLQSRIYETYLNIKKPKIYDVPEVFENSKLPPDTLISLHKDIQKFGGSEKLISNLKKQGYDGVILKNTKMDNPLGGDDYIVFNPDQIKSVYNSGKFVKGSNLYDDKTLSEVINPSTEFQKESLSKALSEANKMTNSKEGTLAHTNEVKKALNDMIDSSMTQGSNMQVKPTAKTNQLMELKNKLDDLLRQNSEIKNLDTEYSRLAKLDDAYQQGFNANPRSKVNLTSDEQKTAFLKGVTDNILSDVKTDSDLSRAIMNKQNVLNKAMGENEYNQLMSNVSDTSSQYDKLRSVLNRARATTGRYSNLESPANLRELGDSKYSAALYGLGRLANSIYGITNRKIAQQIINGVPFDQQSALLEALARANPAVTGSFINQEILGRE